MGAMFFVESGGPAEPAVWVDCPACDVPVACGPAQDALAAARSTTPAQPNLHCITTPKHRPMLSEVSADAIARPPVVPDFRQDCWATTGESSPITAHTAEKRSPAS